MALNFGASKVATGFTLPTSTAAATTSQPTFGAGGEPAQSKPLFGVQATSTVTTSAFSFGTNTTSTTGTASSTFAYSAPGTTIAGTSNFSAPTTTTAAGGFPLTSTTFSVGTTSTPSTTQTTFGLLGSTAKSSSPVATGPSLSTFSLPTSTAPTTSILPSTAALTYAQLEDAINKWTLELEEQGKVFANQAKHLNAWDRLLIGNGEKILNVSSGIERVKQQQQKLDQDLDFVLAQQNELEDCIVPLEKELQDVPIADTERNQTYKLAESIDVQLKQMSDDLKEIIEHLNESNKAQEASDPVVQIGRILSAHMNSLQWIDRSTTQISSQLDEISKMQDLNKK